MADKIYKVFVSSTYEDLRDERSEVQKALLKLNCLPVGMELFPAADEETWEFIKSQIADSDYYVLIVAGRYGSLSPDGTGFTEREFDYAQERKIPTIAFVHGDRGSIARVKSEIDQTLVEKLDAFLRKVRSRPIRTFLSPHELALELTTSFVDLLSRRPAIGYVRANKIVDAKKYSEILERNIELEQQLRSLQTNDVKLDSWFSESIELTARTRAVPERKIQAPWGKIARLIVPYLFSDREENFVFRSIAFGLLKKISDAQNGGLSEYDCELTDKSDDIVRVKFISKNIITVVTEQRADVNTAGKFRNARVWKMTEHGRAQLSLIID
jgi:Domain of unknown function (DUF4062)